MKVVEIRVLIVRVSVVSDLRRPEFRCLPCRGFIIPGRSRRKVPNAFLCAFESAAVAGEEQGDSSTDEIQQSKSKANHRTYRQEHALNVISDFGMAFIIKVSFTEPLGRNLNRLMVNKPAVGRGRHNHQQWAVKVNQTQLD